MHGSLGEGGGGGSAERARRTGAVGDRVEALREAERGDDHVLARELCEGLCASGAWREVWAYAERVLARARQARPSSAGELAAQSAHVLGPVLGRLSGAWLEGGRVPNPLQRYVDALRIYSPGGWFEWLARRCQLEIREPVSAAAAARPAWLEALQTLTPVVTQLLGRAGIALDVRIEVTGASPGGLRQLCWPDGVTAVLSDGRCQMGERCPALPSLLPVGR